MINNKKKYKQYKKSNSNYTTTSFTFDELMNMSNEELQTRIDNNRSYKVNSLDFDDIDFDEKFSQMEDDYFDF